MRKGRPFDGHAYGAIIKHLFPVDNGIALVTSPMPFVPLSNHAVPSGPFYFTAGLKGFGSAGVLRWATKDGPRPADSGPDWGFLSPGSPMPPDLPDGNSDNRAAYSDAPDPLELTGLPTAPVTETGSAHVLPAQRAVTRH